MTRKIISKNSKATQKLATQLAKNLLKAKTYELKSRIMGLTGDLGAGKTTFVQGFLRALGIKGRITSPTFLIFKPYKIKVRGLKFEFQGSTVYHVDCYRLHKPSNITKLGFKKILKNPENIILIEWAEKIKKILPKNTIWIKFFHGKKENERVIEIK
ncbi:MAG: tRNA (adenosine(37)-N6)-threonylcarbamoyltransferase complex ATPase subunit type 1 TsaE [Candidatus Harrisonbacteria bacterium RIFCSPLOWO2_02_FULL_41_13b]|uniref:tRNA threonylcarbamoyladenosine biosynthesis protein TsaE n=1 Tax=Candidatus Harrisonbacteria bacterium RIFCSPLOWO2_02_FULL_41_13b TaxID=1798409 RepID=A0A1G1ZR71_9BACT|nr:MAG: tRNA (adenosine(37)-N6)-threonylcarbamoyltransferase complex ATPase subunit type 1 TsaE [Candidatus Harrisonbacteria bacterium RIFCSPLOWO2_02_FULL_41_13b]